jgi:hypothetical protein
VTLEWRKGAKTAMTNGRNIILPPVKSPVTEDAMDKLYGFVIHECGHHSRPECFDIGNAVKKTAPEELMALFNITEDDGMEREVATAYSGDAIALGKQNAVVLREIAEAWGEAAKEWPEELTDQQVAPIAICALAQLSRMEWDSVSGSSRAAFFNSQHPSCKRLTDTLVTEGWVDKLMATKDPHDTWDLAVDLYKRLFPESDDDETEQCRDKGHAMELQDGTPEDGEGQERGVSGDDTPQRSEGQDGDGSEGSASDEDGEGEGKSNQGAVVSWKDATLSEHNDWTPKELGTKPGNLGIDWTDYQTGTTGLMPPKEINIVDCRGSDEEVEGRSLGGYRDGSPSTFMPDNSQARAFGNQIRRFLQAQRRTRVQRERYRGRIDKSSLIKLALPPVDGGEWNKKLFYDHTKRKEMDTCILVLTDWSGSMLGSKMVHAADASGRLVHVFDRVLKVPVQLAAFTNAQSRCDIGLIKGFNDRSMNAQDIANGFSKFYKYSSANNDADAVMWAYRELKKRKEERRILIVLSDGCPAGSWIGSGSSNLSMVTEQIEKEGQIELYGVGIESDAVETYYSNTEVLESSEEINAALFNIIKKGDKRNARLR